ncbi:MAG: hypothetical protein ACXWEH_07675 [Actinomycetota bacterium]
MRSVKRAFALVAAAGLVTAAGSVSSAVAAPYPPKAPTCAVSPASGAPGTPIRILGAHWKPGSTVSVTMLRGRQRTLGTTMVASGGRFLLRTRVPVLVRPGRAVIRVKSIDASGARRSCTTRFRVLGRAVATSSTSETPKVDVGLTTGGLITLVGLGSGLLIVRRRRGRSLWFGARRDALAEIERGA